jgi:predicted Zn-dependent protease
MAVQGLRASFRQRRLPLHFRRQRNARETVNSFRRLTLEEIQAARPLRIKVITVQPGDTVESLSHRMAGVDRPAERFRVLNGLEPHAQVKTRDRVKIVVD